MNETRNDIPEDLPAPLFESYRVTAYRGGRIFFGPLHSYYAAQPRELRSALRQVPGEHSLESVDGRLYLTVNTYRSSRPNYLLHAGLFVATLITTTVSGAVQRRAGFLPGLEVAARIMAYIQQILLTVAGGIEILLRWTLGEISSLQYAVGQLLSPLAKDTLWLAGGLPFSLTLLAILGAHELCHYAAARRRGIRCTLPYFLPVPFLIGTLGALIRVRSPFVHRRALLEVGVAGPLASFVLGATAIGIAIIIDDVRVGPLMLNRAGEVVILHDSLFLYSVLNMVFATDPNETLYVGQVFWAGWIGMFVTMLNLLPVGQLDGGHVLYAVSRKAHQKLQKPLLWAMFISGLAGFVMNTADGLIRSYGQPMFWLKPIATATPPVWPGWLFWALVILFFLRSSHPPVLEERVSLDGFRIALAVAAAIVLILTFIPNPISILPRVPLIPPGGFPV